MMVIIAILSTIIVVQTYAIYNLFKKVVTYEKWIQRFSRTVEQVNKRLAEIDKRGTFQTPEEIEYFYQQVRNLMSMIINMGFFDEDE